MSEAIYALLGLVMIITVVIIVFKKWTPPWVCFVIVPVIFCLIAGYSLEETSGFIKSGVSGMLGSALLAFLSMVYFSIMTDVGLFDPPVSWLLRKCDNNPCVIMVIASAIAHISHIDTGSTSTLLLTIPTMLPVFKKLKIDPVYLFIITAQAVGVMNWLPWSSGMMIAAGLVGADAATGWVSMSPSFVAGVLFNLACAWYFGICSKKSGAYIAVDEEVLDEGVSRKVEIKDVKLDKRYWANVIITVLVFIGIFEATFQAYYVFMLGMAFVCMINYRSIKESNKAIDSYAENAYRITMTMFCSGVLIGVMTKSAMMEAMASYIVGIIPNSLHHLFGLVSAGLAATVGMVVNRDTYMYGMASILVSTAQAMGYPADAVAYISIAVRDASAFINPTNARFFMCAGMCGVGINRAWKKAIIPILLLAMVEVIAAVLFGVLPI